MKHISEILPEVIDEMERQSEQSLKSEAEKKLTRERLNETRALLNRAVNKKSERAA